MNASSRRQWLFAALGMFWCALAPAGALAGALAGAPAAGLAQFEPATMTELRSRYAGQPFVVAFWSVTCVPCREELPHWGKWQRRHPGVPILLVATDGPEDHEAVGALLATERMEGVGLYGFADGFAERIRYAVDRGWYGEVPRTYFFDRQHRVESRSGRLDGAWVEGWLKSALGAQR